MATEQVLEVSIRRHIFVSERPFARVLDGIFGGISRPDIRSLFIPEGAGPCQGVSELGFSGCGGCAGACVTSVCHSPIAADVCGERLGRSRTGRSRAAQRRRRRP